MCGDEMMTQYSYRSSSVQLMMFENSNNESCRGIESNYKRDLLLGFILAEKDFHT